MLAAACRWLDTRIITLCTGTRDPDDMWRGIPDNVQASVWSDLVERMRRGGARSPTAYEVTLAFEPEMDNVVNSAVKARRLLDEIGSPWLKVVIDPANLFQPGELPRMKEILDEAFELLGSDIVLAHAKELGAGRPRPATLAPGNGECLDSGPSTWAWLRKIGVRRHADPARAARARGCPVDSRFFAPKLGGSAVGES